MNYTLHQLRIFREVVRMGSITLAAKEMHMTQPALSIQLKNFQGQFEHPLVEVISKKLYVTDFGKSISVIADNILREAEILAYKTKEYGDLLAGKLRISSASTGKYLIPYFLNGFIQQHPGIDLVLDVSNKTRVIQNLYDNEIDFALVSVPPTDKAILEEPILENKLFLIGNTPEYDKKRPLIYREPGSATRGAMDDYYKGRGERKSLELTSNETVKQAVIAGLGYSILPLIGIKNELVNEDVHIIPAKGLPITTNWRLIWLEKKRLSAVAEAYLEYIREEKESIIQSEFQWYLEYDPEEVQ